MGFFFFVNDNVKVDFGNIQIMRCTLCYQNLVIGINLITQMRIGLIFYYKTSGMNVFLKHMHAKYILITKRFVEEVNNVLEITKKTIIKERNKSIWRGNL